MTALLAPQSPAPSPSPAPTPTARSAARQWARSTPGWLRLASISVATVTAVAVVLGVGVASSRGSSSATARSTAGSALIDAQTLAVALSDADTTAAGSYLVSGSPSTALTTRYQDDLANAAAALSRLSSARGSTGDAAQLQTLSTDIPIFTGLVETARVNVEQGRVVGAAYLGEADSLMHDHILPAADDLYQTTRARVERADANATNRVPLVVVVVAFVVAVAGLVVLQWQLSRRFRRTLNLPLVAATVLVLVAGTWTTAALVLQGRAVDQSRRDGSDPIAALTGTQGQAQQLRADDELTLVSRDTNPNYQKEYDDTASKLQATVDSDRIGGDQATRAALHDAYAAVIAAHQQVRDKDQSGKPAEAILIATGDPSASVSQPAVDDRLQQLLADGLANRRVQFATVASSALDDLRGLTVGVLLLGGVAVTLVIVGARRRLQEYR